MTLSFALPRIEEHRVSVVFDCPSCRSAGVRGTAYNLRETIRLRQGVPAWGWSSHWVRCSHCRAELSADCEPKALIGASAATVNGRVHAYWPFPKRVLAVAGLATSWTPVVGVLVALAALWANARTAGWPRAVSVTALVLTGLINAAMFGTLAYLTLRAATPLAG